MYLKHEPVFKLQIFEQHFFHSFLFIVKYDLFKKCQKTNK